MKRARVVRFVRWPVVLAGALACLGLLWQMYYESAEVEDGGTMSTMFRVVFWAQIGSVLLLIVGMVVALREGGRRVGIAAVLAGLASLCPVWMAGSALQPRYWASWGRALKKFPWESGDRLAITLLPAVFAGVLLAVLVRRRMAMRVDPGAGSPMQPPIAVRD